MQRSLLPTVPHQEPAMGVERLTLRPDEGIMTVDEEEGKFSAQQMQATA